MKQHHRAKHGVDALEVDEAFKCPHCGKMYQIKKSMLEHRPVWVNNPNQKGPFYCRVAGSPSAGHAFTQMKNLNSHLSNVHGWTERQA